MEDSWDLSDDQYTPFPTPAPADAVPVSQWPAGTGLTMSGASELWSRVGTVSHSLSCPHCFHCRLHWRLQTSAFSREFFSFSLKIFFSFSFDYHTPMDGVCFNPICCNAFDQFENLVQKRERKKSESVILINPEASYSAPYAGIHIAFWSWTL